MLAEVLETFACLIVLCCRLIKSEGGEEKGGLEHNLHNPDSMRTELWQGQAVRLKD